MVPIAIIPETPLQTEGGNKEITKGKKSEAQEKGGEGRGASYGLL